MDAPEFKLLLACCRCSYAPGAVEEVHRCSGHVDWAVFLRLARRHRVQSLVAQAFYKAELAPPQSIAAQITVDAAEIAETNLRSAAESIRLLDRFAGQSIPILFIKGLTLSALAYGDPFIKMSADIDVLVDPADADRSARILRAMGYSPIIPRASRSDDLSRWHRRHRESIWVHPKSGLVIELHSRLSEHPALVRGLGMSSPRQEVPIGSDRSLPTLRSKDLLAYLCVHGAASAWFRLKWIVDLVALLHASGASIEEVLEHARANAAGRAPAQALLLAERLQLLRLPADVRHKLEADPASRLLAKVAVAQILSRKEPTQRAFGTLPIHLTQPLLLPGWRFKFSDSVRQIIEIVDRRR